MILDSLKNAALYESVHPRFKKAFEFLQNKMWHFLLIKQQLL